MVEDQEEPIDVGVIAEVAESERLDVDEGPGSDASEGGADDDLADVYADPGDVVELEEGSGP